MSKELHTKFGTASLRKDGYYRINTHDKGHHNKLLHRVIFEDFYCEIPEGYHVHHKNENRTDNCILNLQLMKNGAHISLHNKKRKGFHHSEETKQKLREANLNKPRQYNKKNTSGIYNVCKHRNKKCKQGFTWEYSYRENGKRKYITSTSLSKLKEKVLAKGLNWIKISQLR